MKTPKFIYLLAPLFAVLIGTLNSDADVIARWSFDETSGTVVHDSVDSLTGTLSSQGSSFVSGGISGNALSLNRALNGYVNFGSVLGFTTQPFSFVTWVKTAPGYSTSDSEVFSRHQGFSDNGYWMLLNQTTGGGQAGKALFGEGTVTKSVQSTTTVTDGLWHQIVCTFQPSVSLSIYVDGAPVEGTRVASSSLVANSAAFLIGGIMIGSAPEGRYTGLVDEMQVYNEALTADQVNYLFLHPTQVVPEPTGLYAFGPLALLAWRMFRRGVQKA